MILVSRPTTCQQREIHPTVLPTHLSPLRSPSGRRKLHHTKRHRPEKHEHNQQKTKYRMRRQSKGIRLKLLYLLVPWTPFLLMSSAAPPPQSPQHRSCPDFVQNTDPPLSRPPSLAHAVSSFLCCIAEGVFSLAGHLRCYVLPRFRCIPTAASLEEREKQK